MNIKKKLVKNFFIQNFLALIASFYIFFVKISSRIKYQNTHIPEKYWKNNKPFILAFWHSQLMTVTFAWAIKEKVNILASEHSDGRFGSIVGSYFKINNVPISKINNAIAIRPIFKLLASNHYIGVTPDGPRGPKEKVSEGIIKIAKISKIPIIPLGFWSSKNFNLKSWDSFLITLPFSKCCFVWGNEINIPENLNDNEIIKFQKIIEDKINDCIQKAKLNLK